MAFTGFPTPEALSLAQIHCDRHSRIPHREVAENIHDRQLHIDDWAAAVRRLSGIKPGDDEDETLQFESEIAWVESHYYAMRYEMGEERREE